MEQEQANQESSSDSYLIARPSAPLYTQLADILREKIYSKEWAIKSKIPSEHELMDKFGVARGTVRRALKTLVDEGLLEQHHGKGTFVAEPGISHPAGVRPLSFAKSLKKQGKDFTTKVIDLRVVAAPVDVAEELEIETISPVMFLRRVRSVDGEPVMVQESWNNLTQCPGLDRIDYTKENLFDAVERCSGGKIKYSKMRYQARVAGKEHGELLACEDTAAVLLLEQTITLDTGIPIEWSNTWFKPGQSIIGMAMQADS